MLGHKGGYLPLADKEECTRDPICGDEIDVKFHSGTSNVSGGLTRGTKTGTMENPIKFVSPVSLGRLYNSLVQ